MSKKGAAEGDLVEVIGNLKPAIGWSGANYCTFIPLELKSKEYTSTALS
jgi:hypothetical protein